MQIVVHTVYSNVDSKWVDWYVNHLCTNGGLKDISAQLANNGYACLENKDPDSFVTAKTTYEIIDEEP